ncbi:MAG: hypothetical protein HFI54_09270 [Lachnospiraceae bacterium]|nr:hypothetical protein [Lachnospiraceae bacterium]
MILHYKEYLFAIAILFAFWAFGIGSTYGFSIFPDEFAYWSYAARLAGYDWSDVTALAPYYSYGYSLILIPIFVFCKDAVTAYRIAVSINFLFLFLAMVALAGTMKRMMPDKKMPIVLFSALTVLLPCNLFYTQMTLTEVFLVALYIAAGSVLYRYLENNRLSTLLLLMLILIYLYTVHMRTVGVLLAAMIVVTIHIFLRGDKRWHVLAALGAALALFAAADFLKQQAFVYVYGGINQELVAANDYSGQMEKIRSVLSLEGFYDLLISLAGKVLYLGLATWGLFYWGIYGMVRQAFALLRNIKRHVSAKPQQFFAVFVLLTVAAQIVIGTIYLLTLGEIGDYTYGRYSEMVIPFVMVWGFAVLWKERARFVWTATGGLALLQGLTTFLVVRQIIVTGADNFQGYFLVGISYLYNEADFQVDSFYAAAYLFCELLTVLVTAMALFCRSRKKRQYLLTAFAVVELVLAMRADIIYLEPFKKAAFRDSRMVDKMQTMQEEGRRIIYMDQVFPPYVGILQFMGRDLDIQVIGHRETVADYEGDITDEDILIFAFDDAFLEEWEDKYAQKDVYGHFALLYD